ncbi:class F sortase [Pseudokineococcus sp. 1T1Z-3]|uniref:class F sortase n=1 Tax=Pseudokineococcus sp. 1T1Z-3 TaxID=3132745 RepID=UPI00309FE216
MAREHAAGRPRGGAPVRRRGAQAGMVASMTALVLGAGLVVVASFATQPEAPVEPPVAEGQASDGSFVRPGQPASTTPGPSPAPTRPEGLRKSDVLPEDVTAPAGEIPGLVRMAPQEAVEEPEVEVAEPVRLRIPAIGVESDLLHLGLDEAGALEVPSGPDVDRASWYDGSPRPGRTGPAVVAGHIDSSRGPSVFWRLGELAPGDEVFVDRADGTTATFVVDTSERYPKDDFPTMRVYGNTPDAQIRLITCGGAYDRTVGSYLDNTVVYGHLVDG